MFVPVIYKNEPQMPTTPSRAYRWIRSGKATPFWSNHTFCVRLNVEPSDTKKQEVVCGIDPGSKREAFTVKSENHTFINILADSVYWVSKAIESRKNARRNRRQRKTPCRANRQNRACLKKENRLPPSTRARWDLKLRLAKKYKKIYPITDFVIEDIKAKSKKGCKKWNTSFSPLEDGKNWCYSEMRKLGNLYLKSGFETYTERNNLGLKKLSDKMSESFYSHNVDSWVLANLIIGGHTKPDNEEVKRLIPLYYPRRQLHKFQFAKGGIRRREGGTVSLGFKRGSLVKHKKFGLCYVGGHSENRISLHRLKDKKRLTQLAKIEDVKFLCFNSFRSY